MPSLRIPLAEPLTNRDSSASKDSKLTNCFAQTVGGEQSAVIKRPGTLGVFSDPAAQGLGTYCYNSVNYATYTSTLKQHTPGYVPTTPAAQGSIATQTGPKYVVEVNNIAYLTNSSTGSLQIFNVATPSTPSLLSTTTVSGAYGISVVGKYAYILSNNLNLLYVYDVSDPTAPVLKGSVAIGGGPMEITVIGNYAYIVCFSSRFQIIDISNPVAPTVVSTYTTGLTNPTSLSVSGTYAYLIDSTSNNLIILNVSVPATPTLTGSLGLAVAPVAVVVSGSYAYIGTGAASFLIVNVSNPAAPTLTSTTAVNAAGYGVAVLGNYAYLSSNTGNTLQILDVTNKASPSILYTYALAGNPLRLSIVGLYIYIITETSKLLNIIQVNVATTIVSTYSLAPATTSYNFSSYSTLLVFKNTSALYTFDTTTNTLTHITAVNYPVTTVPGLVFLDGTFYVGTPDGKIYGSAIGDPTTWSALNYISAEIENDGLIAIEKTLNYLVAFGEWTTEFFYDAANATGSPLASVPNAFFTIGCASGTSVVRMENEVVWMSQTIQRGRQIMSIRGFTPQVLSDPEVDRILNADDLATVYAFSIKIAGASFYVLTLKTSAKTLVYDFSTKQWHFWTSMAAQAPKSVTSITSANGVATVTEAAHGYADGDLITIAGASPAAYNGSFNITYIDPNTYTYPVPLGTASPATGTITSVGYTESYFNAVAYSLCQGGDLIQGETDGIIYKMSPSYYNDNGNYINMKIKTIRVDGGDTKRKFVSRAEIVGDKISATGLLRYSDDDYQTYSVYRPLDLSAKRSILLRQGHSRRRAYEFRCTTSQPIRLSALELDVKEGTS